MNWKDVVTAIEQQIEHVERLGRINAWCGALYGWRDGPQRHPHAMES